VHGKCALHGSLSGSGEKPRPAYGLCGGHGTRSHFDYREQLELQRSEYTYRECSGC